MLCAFVKVILVARSSERQRMLVFMIAMKHSRHDIVVEGLEENYLFENDFVYQAKKKIVQKFYSRAVRGAKNEKRDSFHFLFEYVCPA